MNDAREVDHGTGGVMNLTGVSDDPVRRYYEHLAGQVMSLKTFIIGELKDSANVHPAMRYITEGAALGFDAAIKSIEAAFAIAEEHPSDDDNWPEEPDSGDETDDDEPEPEDEPDEPVDPTREPVAFLDRVTANVEAQMALDRATQDRHGPAVITVRSRWEADLRDQPLGAPEGWGVSSHTLLRTEAWSVDTSDESADRIEAVLAELPGVVDQGHIHAGEEKDRRPYGWVLRRQTNTNDFCTHTVERWSKETW